MLICKCKSWMQFLFVFHFFSGTCPIITWRSCPRVVLPSWWIWSRCVWDTIPSVTSQRERSEALVPYVRCKCSYPVRKPLGSIKGLILHVSMLIVLKLWHSGLEVYMPTIIPQICHIESWCLHGVSRLKSVLPWLLFFFFLPNNTQKVIIYYM